MIRRVRLRLTLCASYIAGHHQFVELLLREIVQGADVGVRKANSQGAGR